MSARTNPPQEVQPPPPSETTSHSDRVSSIILPAWMIGNRYGLSSSSSHALRTRRKKRPSSHTAKHNNGEEESHRNVDSNTSSNRKHKQPVKQLTCENCKTVETPVWRKGSNGEPLCNKCGLYELRHGRSRLLEFDSIREFRKRKQESECDHTCHTFKSASSMRSGGDPHSEHLECMPTSQKKTKYQSVTNVPMLTTRNSPKDQVPSSVNNNNYGNGDSCSTVSFESQSLLRLKQQLEEAIQKYPEVVCTLISLVQKHVLPQYLSKHVDQQQQVSTTTTTNTLHSNALHPSSTTSFLHASSLDPLVNHSNVLNLSTSLTSDDRQSDRGLFSPIVVDLTHCSSTSESSSYHSGHSSTLESNDEEEENDETSWDFSLEFSDDCETNDSL
ncbi:hypothetical protein FDP41_002285 [Naegleria fowleri]|uniref:GATA-type domain-containing protein n=1 Tax=Naegleria fowleri TaxID=5763 RepID=A0A6A5BYP5_NAEFO|nr:uncharacterized protein FDP41_002285 [Naegleria fowleri]KAF0978465.1 hypothetical protein FDP41_002285 [Naegleria fowleri]CAG4717165.1 unnamed protein product [Naegleria fowleri]